MTDKLVLSGSGDMLACDLSRTPVLVDKLVESSNVGLGGTLEVCGNCPSTVQTESGYVLYVVGTYYLPRVSHHH